MSLIYNTGIYVFALILRVASIFNAKAKDFIHGRKDTFLNLKSFREAIGKAELIWVHCASLGEFEQGRPVMEAMKKRWPEKKILLTFFSPSGYNIRKNYEQADHVCFLPLDTPFNARKFYRIVRPDLAIFVKYEFWYNHLSVLQHHKVPHLLISAIFRPGQVFFKAYGKLFRKLLFGFAHIFVQDSRSVELLAKIGYHHSSRAGDTRVDRVVDIARHARVFPEIEKFVTGSKIFIAGSTWPKGEDILCPLINNDLPPEWKVIIAPHEITDSHLISLEKKLFKPLIRYSQLAQTTETEASVLILDNIGMLASVYKYGAMAYIGGGFGVGIHNILEPATFALPVLFGPNHSKFREAIELKERGGAFSVADYGELKKVFEQLQIPESYASAAKAARTFIEENRGATAEILKFLETGIFAGNQEKRK